MKDIKANQMVQICLLSIIIQRLNALGQYSTSPPGGASCSDTWAMTFKVSNLYDDFILIKD